jgi:type IV secretory pathway VirB4 component
VSGEPVEHGQNPRPVVAALERREWPPREPVVELRMARERRIGEELEALRIRDELANWRSGERLQATVSDRSAHEAQLAAMKLSDWTGEDGTYSKLFDRHTNVQTDASWLFFDIDSLSSDTRLETAMSLLIANAMTERSSGRMGKLSITVLDECWALLDSPVLAPEVVQLFRTVRKRKAIRASWRRSRIRPLYFYFRRRKAS